MTSPLRQPSWPGRDINAILLDASAPTTGAQKCESCDGWIMDANHFWVPCWDGHFMRMCSGCYDKWLHPEGANTPREVRAPR